MRYTDGHGRGPSRPLFNANSRLQLARVEYKVVTKAHCGLVWKIFSDCKQWHTFSDLHGDIEWRGTPWAPGSRLQTQLLRPVVTRVDRVITVCSPGRYVAWIGHAAGYAWEQWVLFDPHHEGGTQVSTWIEVIGIASFERCNQERVHAIVEEWYDGFRDECDRVAEGA